MQRELASLLANSHTLVQPGRKRTMAERRNPAAKSARGEEDEDEDETDPQPFCFLDLPVEVRLWSTRSYSAVRLLECLVRCP